MNDTQAMKILGPWKRRHPRAIAVIAIVDSIVLVALAICLIAFGVDGWVRFVFLIIGAVWAFYGAYRFPASNPRDAEHPRLSAAGSHNVRSALNRAPNPERLNDERRPRDDAYRPSRDGTGIGLSGLGAPGTTARPRCLCPWWGPGLPVQARVSCLPARRVCCRRCSSAAKPWARKLASSSCRQSSSRCLPPCSWSSPMSAHRPSRSSTWWPRSI